ncbi:MAG: serine/threonine-protein kinase, partial [Mycobacterium sp.]
MAASATRIGSMFGKYRLTRLLGQGGMGEVYEAYDTTKDRTVALKILPQELSRDEQYRTRFQRESRMAAMLEEPHVIPIYDWGGIDGNLFIDMRMVRGQDLHELLKRGPLQPERAVGIIRQIASALDAAHGLSLIHRDVKPQNILVTASEDFAYLIDFGIAQHRTDTRLTLTGSAIGSFAYMAPERFEERPPTAAVDVYSLAAVLYEALTGRTPFAANGVEQLIVAHLSAPPPRPSVVNPCIPPAFDGVIARGMAKDPDDRYGSCGALGRAAQRALTSGPSSRPSTGPTETPPDPPPRPAGYVPYQAGPAIPAWQAAQPESSSGSARPWLVPAVIVVGVGALLLGGIGVVIGLLAGHSSAPATNSSRSTGSNVATPTLSYQPESPPSAPAPATPGGPQGATGPDNSATHESCDAGYSLTNMTGFGTHSRRGSPQTSCFFTKSVLVSYWNQYGNASRQQ